MTLLALHSVSKSFGARPILAGLDFEVRAGARIGVIGPNGGGKSTMLRLLAGLEDPDAGEAVRRRGVEVAFLPQQVPGDERTALETVHAARPDLEEIEAELQVVGDRIGALADDLERMGRALQWQEELVERFTAAGGPGFEGRTRTQLLDLGLEEAELTLPTTALSGGQRKLVALAACLATGPGVLLLDEPETHLDSAHRERLEAFVRSFDGAVVSVSHDRYLLDETVSQIAELAGGCVRLWPGNYSAYATARELDLARQQVLYVTQQKEIARLEAAIRRFKDWADRVVDERHIKQARNKQRQIDRMEKIDRPVLERRRIALSLRSAARGGERVVELRAAGASFGDHPVLAGVDLTVLRGERVGIVGENGAGKSVLLKVLAGELEPTAGERWAGPSIRIGYLAQDLRPADPGATVLQTVRLADRLSEGEAVGLLMKFGGANCLLLDEPTNHLDIDSVEMLEQAIEEFDGTAVFSSHDRYFLDRISDRIVEVAGGAARSYEGGYSDWNVRRSELEPA